MVKNEPVIFQLTLKPVFRQRVFDDQTYSLRFDVKRGIRHGGQQSRLCLILDPAAILEPGFITKLFDLGDRRLQLRADVLIGIFVQGTSFVQSVLVQQIHHEGVGILLAECSNARSKVMAKEFRLKRFFGTPVCHCGRPHASVGRPLPDCDPPWSALDWSYYSVCVN